MSDFGTFSKILYLWLSLNLWATCLLHLGILDFMSDLDLLFPVQYWRWSQNHTWTRLAFSTNHNSYLTFILGQVSQSYLGESRTCSIVQTDWFWTWNLPQLPWVAWLTSLCHYAWTSFCVIMGNVQKGGGSAHPNFLWYPGSGSLLVPALCIVPPTYSVLRSSHAMRFLKALKERWTSFCRCYLLPCTLRPTHQQCYGVNSPIFPFLTRLF